MTEKEQEDPADELRHAQCSTRSREERRKVICSGDCGGVLRRRGGGEEAWNALSVRYAGALERGRPDVGRISLLPSLHTGPIPKYSAPSPPCFSSPTARPAP